MLPEVLELVRPRTEVQLRRAEGFQSPNLYFLVSNHNNKIVLAVDRCLVSDTPWQQNGRSVMCKIVRRLAWQTERSTCRIVMHPHTQLNATCSKITHNTVSHESHGGQLSDEKGSLMSKFFDKQLDVVFPMHVHPILMHLMCRAR
jgi:hypothetical protein